MSTSPLQLRGGISTGSVEIDRQIGHGVPWGSVTVIEGRHGAGKSVLCQHLSYNALQSQSGVAFYTSDVGSPSLVAQMKSLGLDVLDHFLMDQLRIHPLELSEEYPEPTDVLNLLLRHIMALPPEFELIVIDSLTPLLPFCTKDEVLDFFFRCHQLSREGRTIVAVLDTRAMSVSLTEPLYSWCDIHLRLRMEVVTIERVVKALDVFKPVGDSVEAVPTINFDVEPGHGIRVVLAKRESSE
ncbi:MAG: ATPase domain-containing protein [Dehalococcoidia bacterium]